MRIGLLSAGSRRWIAGSLYLHNIIRALHLLTDTEDVALELFARAGSGVDEAAELGDYAPRRHVFAYRNSWPFWKKAAGSALSIVERKRPRRLEDLVKESNADVLFPATVTSLGSKFPVPWIGWIPDFQHKHLPQFTSPAIRALRDRQMELLISEAAHVVVSSHDAMKDLERWFPHGHGRASVLHFPTVADPKWYEVEPELPGLPEKFLVFPSQIWVHKNHRVLFEAIRLLRDGGVKDIALVCTGYEGDPRLPSYFAELKSWVRQHSLEQQIVFSGLLPRSHQIQIVRRAVALVQPSLFEGWSAVVEDARTFGKRIYLSDLAVHREQDPSDAVFFDAHAPDQLADLIAGDWSQLRPGPDPERERQAFAEQTLRARLFAQTFLGILDKALGRKLARV